jgi:hypothetical protein
MPDYKQSKGQKIMANKNSKIQFVNKSNAVEVLGRNEVLMNTLRAEQAQFAAIKANYEGFSQMKLGDVPVTIAGENFGAFRDLIEVGVAQDGKKLLPSIPREAPLLFQLDQRLMSMHCVTHLAPSGIPPWNMVCMSARLIAPKPSRAMFAQRRVRTVSGGATIGTTASSLNPLPNCSKVGTIAPKRWPGQTVKSTTIG